LKHIAFSIQSSLTRAAIVRQERKRYWLLKELQKKTGDVLDALVLDMKIRGCTVVLPEYLLDVYLNIPETLSIAPGDTVPVVVRNVDPFERSLKVEFAAIT
ncbi:MAG: exoribonuclease II, partial [Deltaproteobacteria bacterium]|nr:exoribonuclease II [Deltaproteobacteria bacterium]